MKKKKFFKKIFTSLCAFVFAFALILAPLGSNMSASAEVGESPYGYGSFTFRPILSTGVPYHIELDGTTSTNPNYVLPCYVVNSGSITKHGLDNGNVVYNIEFGINVRGNRLLYNQYGSIANKDDDFVYWESYRELWSNQFTLNEELVQNKIPTFKKFTVYSNGYNHFNPVTTQNGNPRMDFSLGFTNLTKTLDLYGNNYLVYEHYEIPYDDDATFKFGRYDVHLIGDNSPLTEAMNFSLFDNTNGFSNMYGSAIIDKYTFDDGAEFCVAFLSYTPIPTLVHNIYYMTDGSADNQQAYENGFNVGVGYADSRLNRNSISYYNGYADGEASVSQYGTTFKDFFGAVVDAPVNAFRNIFSFDFFGYNLSSLIGGVLTLCIAIIILKFVRG